MNKILEMFDDAMMNDFNEFEKELIVDAVEAGDELMYNMFLIAVGGE